MGLQITSGAGEVVQVADFAPRIALSEAFANGDQPIMRRKVVDSRALKYVVPGTICECYVCLVQRG